MSTLAGQSVLQPLQARHRSRASRTSVGAPAVGDRAVAVAVEHLEQQPGAAAGGVLLLAGDLVGRAHHGAAVVLVLAALADPDAAVARPAGTSRRRRGRRRTAARSAAGPSRRRAAGAGRAGGVRRPCRGSSGPAGSKSALTSSNRRDDLVAEHPRQQLAAGLPVAVLAGQRAAVGRRPGRRRAPGSGGRSRRLRWCRGRTGCGCARSPGRSGRTGWARCRWRSRTPRRARAGRAGSRRAGRRGPRSPPSPPRCRARSGTCAVAPSPASRTCHSSSSRSGSSRNATSGSCSVSPSAFEHRAAPAGRPRRWSSPPNCTIRKPVPFGQLRRAPRRSCP